MNRQSLPHIGVIVRANRGIGTGHLMRVKCVLPRLAEHAFLELFVYAFDEALRPMCSEYDAVHVFDTRDDVLEHLRALAHADSARTADSTAAADAAAAAGAAAGTAAADADSQRLPDLLIIDDYAIDEAFESELYDYTRIFVIDDLCDRRHRCHMLLDQTLITREEGYAKLCNEDCQLLLGSRYSFTADHFYPQNYPLDYRSTCTCGAHHFPLSGRALWGKSKEQLSSMPASCLCQDGQTQGLPRVFVSFGGADPVSACLNVCRSVIAEGLHRSYSFTVLAGAANKDYQQLLALAAALPPDEKRNLLIIHHCNDVADLLFRHDLALGAYGGMFRERIAAALPTAGVEIADNQEGAAFIVSKFELGVSLTMEQLKDGKAIRAALDDLMENSSTYSRNCLKVYDGEGLNRIAAALLSLLPSCA